MKLKEEYINNIPHNCPYQIEYSNCFLYNDKIYVFVNTNKYVYDDNGWNYAREIPSLPYNSNRSCTIEYNGELHMFGGDYNSGDQIARNHYKYDGNSWTKLNNLPGLFMCPKSVIYNNEIYLIGGYYSDNYLYRYDVESDSVVDVRSMPYSAEDCCRIITYRNEIHLFGGLYNHMSYHYIYNGSWTKLDDSDFKFSDGSLVLYDNKIALIGGKIYTKSTSYKYSSHIYLYDGVKTKIVGETPYKFYEGSAFEYKNKVFIVGGTTSNSNDTPVYSNFYNILVPVLSIDKNS